MSNAQPKRYKNLNKSKLFISIAAVAELGQLVLAPHSFDIDSSLLVSSGNSNLMSFFHKDLKIS